MNGQITKEQMHKFRKQYHLDKTNKLIEHAIVNNGIQPVALNQDVIRDNQWIFNVELEKTKRLSQGKTGRCWIASGLNTIKYDVAKNMNVNPINVRLSQSYLGFYDKFEKLNFCYEKVIATKDVEINKILENELIQFKEGGNYLYFRNLVKKYGLVPSKYMCDTVTTRNTEMIMNIMYEKLVYGVDALLKLKRENASMETLREYKEMFLMQDYEILSKLLGEPVQTFDLEYIDKDKNLIQKKNMTPQQFEKEYVTLDLDDFILVGSTERYDKEYYQVYQNVETCNMYESSAPIYLNLPIDEVKELVICQLKDGIPVSFGTDISKMMNLEYGILDARIYNYEELLHMNLLTREQLSNYHISEKPHAMTFVGVHLDDDGKPVRWKVENSWGNKDSDGLFIMNDNYFDKFVRTISTPKKYLKKTSLEALEQEPIPCTGVKFYR